MTTFTIQPLNNLKTNHANPRSPIHFHFQFKGYKSHDEAILGSVVLVLILRGQADPRTVVGLTGCKQ